MAVDEPPRITIPGTDASVTITKIKLGGVVSTRRGPLRATTAYGNWLYAPAELARREGSPTSFMIDVGRPTRPSSSDSPCWTGSCSSRENRKGNRRGGG